MINTITILDSESELIMNETELLLCDPPARCYDYGIKCHLTG